MNPSEFLIDSRNRILVTGAAGFIGTKVVGALLDRGFTNLRCLVRSSSDLTNLQETISAARGESAVEIVRGNLLSRDDCERATREVSVIYHLAAGTGTKAFAEAFANSVVTTRNLLDAVLHHGCLRRFVSVSSFVVYTNRDHPRPNLLDENCPIESSPALRGDPYCFAKSKQDELVSDYGKKHGIPYVLVRPGVVYGPGKRRIHGRIGIDTFGIFLHFGGSNQIPLTFVDNCAEAIVLSGVKSGIEGEAFNVVDDDLPSSTQFLHMYKKEVADFRSFYVPHFASYLFCFLWEKYSTWSGGQLPPVYNRRVWASVWKRTRYSNQKIKNVLGWAPKVSTADGLKQYFVSCRAKASHA
jgi:nucleoside-diphosphate-sugar epimerase